jgi:hypothetical protein
VTDPVPVSDEQVAACLRKVAIEVLPQATALSDSVLLRILEKEPRLAPQHTSEQIEVVRVAVEQNVGGILAMFAFGIEADLIEPIIGTVALLRQTAEDGGDVTRVLHGYRVGHGQLWQLWAGEVEARVADAELRHRVLALSTARMFAFIDSACERLVEESRQLFGIQGGGWRPPGRDVIDLLRSDGPVDLIEASLALGYEVRDHHVALVAVALGADADARAAVRVLADAGEGCSVLDQSIGEGSWWAWLGWPSAPSDEVLERLAATTVPGVLIGMGEPGQGREGFRRSHLEAVEAERTSRMARASRGGVVRHRDVEVAAVLCADPERARRLAEGRLGALARRDEATSRLRATVRAYLAVGRNLARTAEALHVHHKTVSYRLAKATELLGHPIAEAAYDLEAALIIDFTLHGE